MPCIGIISRLPHAHVGVMVQLVPCLIVSGCRCWANLIPPVIRNSRRRLDYRPVRHTTHRAGRYNASENHRCLLAGEAATQPNVKCDAKFYVKSADRGEVGNVGQCIRYSYTVNVFNNLYSSTAQKTDTSRETDKYN